MSDYRVLNLLFVRQDNVLGMLRDAMIKVAADSKGYLIDGYPRELEQGKKFENDVGPVQSIIYFDVADETMMARLLERAKTSGRTDDNEVTIAKRLKTFHDNNQQIIDYYSKQNKVWAVCS